jgi:hypothetical protein
VLEPQTGETAGDSHEFPAEMKDDHNEGGSAASLKAQDKPPPEEVELKES